MPEAYTLFGELKADTNSFKNSLRDADRSLLATKKSIEVVEGDARSLGVTTATSGRQFQKLNEVLAQAQQRLNLTADAFRKGEASQSQMRAALIAVDKAAQGVNSRLSDAAARAEDYASRQSAAAQKAAERFVREQEKMAAAADKAAREAAFSWERFGDKIRSIGEGMMSFGAKLSIAITAPLTLASREALKAGTSYETALNVFGSVTKATAGQMADAAKIAKELGADLSLPATSAKDAALAMVELGKAGLTAQQAMDGAKGVLQLAAAGQLEEAQAAEIAANALNSFGLAAKDTGRIADLLAAAANASSAEVSDVAAAMSQASAVAAGAKIPIEDLVTAIGLLANAGIKGSDAGTSIKTFISRLTAPTDKAASAMESLGLKVFDTEGKMKSLPTIISEFSSQLAGLNDEAKAATLYEIFGSDALRAAQILFKEGTAGFEAMKKGVTEVGAAGRLATAITKGVGGAWDGLLSQLETFGIEVFEAIKEPLAASLRAVAGFVGTLTDAFKNSPQLIQVLTVAFGVLAAVAGPALIAIGAAISAIATPAVGVALLAVLGLLIQIGPVIAIVAGQVYLLYQAWQTNFGGIQEITFKAIGTVQGAIQSFLATIQAFWNEHGTAITATLTSLWNVIASVINTALVQIQNFMKLGLQLINGDWDGAWQTFLKIVKDAAAGVTDLLVRALLHWENVLRTVIPILAEWGLKFLTTMTGWVAKAIVGVVTLISKLPMLIVQMIPQFLAAGAAIGTAIKDGVTGALANLFNGQVSGSISGSIGGDGLLDNLMNSLGLNEAAQAGGGSVNIPSPAPTPVPSVATAPSASSAVAGGGSAYEKGIYDEIRGLRQDLRGGKGKGLVDINIRGEDDDVDVSKMSDTGAMYGFGGFAIAGGTNRN